ncbi:MAG: hypothetical protein ACOC1G_07780 [Phycisphaeraceae bacterium]
MNLTPHTCVSLGLLALMLSACGTSSGQGAGDSGVGVPLGGVLTDWSDHEIWYDGQAEIARYEATRVIYGEPRSYTATLYTNREMLDLQTQTKSQTDEGVAVFKFHTRDEAIPTPNYNYDFSTMVYLDFDELSPWKLEMGSQEDCGTTFKRYWIRDGNVNVMQSSYFPGEGVRGEGYGAPTGMVFQDSLPLLLRAFPFDDPPSEPIRIPLVIDQTNNHLSPQRPIPYAVTYRGTETLQLPVGEVEAHRLEVTPSQRNVPDPGAAESHFWFAVDGEAPMLHALVQYRGPFGTEYRLKSLTRGKYWAQ